MKWSVFNRWDVQNQTSLVGKLLQQPNSPIVNVDDPQASTPSVRFADTLPQIHDDGMTALSSEAKSLSLETLDEPPIDIITESSRRTRSHSFRPPPIITVDNPIVQRALSKIATSPSYKVTGNTTATPIFSSSDNDMSIHHIFTDDMCITYSSVDGMAHASIDKDDILDMFLFHTCIQSNPGEPKSWKEALHGQEREW